MSARDKYHEHFKAALENDGWEVTHDPYKLFLVDEFGKKSKYEIDLGAEKLIAANKGSDKIAIELKTFGGSSTIYEFHLALG